MHINFTNLWMCVTVHCILTFSLDYLKQIAGPRTVPIELGSRYTDKNWTQKLMTLSEFITNHVSSKVRTVVCQTGSVVVGYLAQHQLFDQVI